MTILHLTAIIMIMITSISTYYEHKKNNFKSFILRDVSLWNFINLILIIISIYFAVVIIVKLLIDYGDVVIF